MFERIFTLDYILLFTGICSVCAVTMLGIYVRIYLIARKHSRQIAKIHSILGQQQSQNPIQTNQNDDEDDDEDVTNTNRIINNNNPEALSSRQINQDFFEMDKITIGNFNLNQVNY